MRDQLTNGQEGGHELQALERLLQGRHSCRGFLPTPVPREVIERIASVAQRTASWCNSQPWQVVVTTGAATARLREAMLAAAVAQQPPRPDVPWPLGYPGDYADRRRTCGLQLYESVGVARGDRVGSAAQALENFRFFGAPHVAIISSEEALGPYGAVDCGAYVGHFMLAAQAHGVATIAQAALSSWPDLVREVLDMPRNRQIICGISFGYEDEAHPANGFRTERAALHEVLHWRS